MTDQEIIALYWQRDDRAITQSNVQYGDYCHSIAFHILSNTQDSEECVNDTWLRAWRSMPPERPSRLKAFFGRICRNLSLDRYRRGRASKRGGGEMELILSELDGVTQDTPQTQLELKELGELINGFLARLNTDSRRIFLRRYWYADSIRDIAQRYGQTEAMVKSSLYRTRQRLRAYLQEEGYL